MTTLRLKQLVGFAVIMSVEYTYIRTLNINPYKIYNNFNNYSGQLTVVAGWEDAGLKIPHLQSNGACSIEDL